MSARRWDVSVAWARALEVARTGLTSLAAGLGDAGVDHFTGAVSVERGPRDNARTTGSRPCRGESISVQNDIMSLIGDPHPGVEADENSSYTRTAGFRRPQRGQPVVSREGQTGSMSARSPRR